MYTLFIGLTFLIAHVFFFSAYDLGWFLRNILLNQGLPLFASRYLASAAIVGLFFYWTKLPQRLANPMPGRGLILIGVIFYCLHALILYGGLKTYRPGLGLLFIPSMYVASIAMLFIFVGTGRALLEAAPISKKVASREA